MAGVRAAAALLVAAGAAVAELPPARPPALPFPAEPSAEAVRPLHEMVPPHDDEPMTKQEMAANFQRFLDARGGRFEPVWANHTHAERTANLQHHHARRRSERRRAQVMLGAPKGGPTAQNKTTDLIAMLGSPEQMCDDPLAVNDGGAAPCTYNCADLQSEYFPQPQSQTTRCFLFDPDTETWPEVGGQGAELLSMREQRFETHTYISKEDGTNPPPAGLSFTVGTGSACRNVTVRSTFAGAGEGAGDHVEVLCLVDGEHEYDHTITGNHSVEVVGFAESGLHEGAGGTTSFVVGMCTDVLIRVETLQPGQGASWSLDDGGHNGPWSFDAPDDVNGMVEYETCMFNNDFTLTQVGGSDWQGSVEVVGFVHYHNTITIPNNENWIVQGIVDPATGLPSSLDGRIKSGTAVDRSHANIVMRHVRLSGQVAPADVNVLPRPEVIAGQTHFGGAFDYDGGGEGPDDLVQIKFIGMVFDHNSVAVK